MRSRNLQETGSYAEFSRLLQHTADGNVFKKVALADRNDVLDSFFSAFFVALHPTIVQYCTAATWTYGRNYY